MRIAIVTGCFPKLSETFVLDQIAALVELGHDVRVFTFEKATESVQHAKVARHALLDRTLVLETSEPSGPRGAFARLLSPRSWFGSARQREALALRLAHGEKGAFDVIYCHFGHVAERARGLVDAGFFSGPLVVVFHAYDLYVVPRLRGKDFYAALFAKAERLLPVTERGRELLVELGADPRKVEVRRMGVDLAAFSFRERNLAPGATLRLVSVGRLVEKKGFSVAIEALAGARSRLPVPVEYHVVGDGPLRSDLERLASERGVSELVTFHGSKSHAEVAALLDTMQVLVAPSVTAKDGDSEGLPVVLLEAMARGLTVVATNHSGIPELVRDGENGRLVAENDANALGQALLELAAEPARLASLGRAGRRSVEDAHDATRLARELVALFEELSARSRANAKRRPEA